MINIYEYLLSKKHQNANDGMPHIGKIAYDWHDEPWEIIDFCYKNDNKIKDFISSYDTSGWITDDDLAYMDDDTILVAAKNEDIGIEVIEWDESSGLHYK